MSDGAADAHMGRVLGGRYRIGVKLGQGGMGAVYEGVQEDLGRSVAIKILKSELLDDAQLVARLRREAEATALLRHPHIVQLVDFQWHDGEPPFLVMERLSGVTLGHVLREQPILPAERVARVALQVLSALRAAHAAGIVHRDLKPDNVFLASMPGMDEGFVKVLDFGVAKLIDERFTQLTDTGVVVGTPTYMAPEQICGEAVDARADLYSLGVVMYKALAGRPPFTGGWSELVHAAHSLSPTPLRTLRPDIDPELAEIVERAMAKLPSWRFASSDEMHARLEAWLAARGAVGHAPTLSEQRAPAAPQTGPPLEPTASAASAREWLAAPAPAPTPTPAHAATPAIVATPRRRRGPLAWIGFAVVASIGVAAAALVLASAGSTAERDPSADQAASLVVGPQPTVPIASTGVAVRTAAAPSAPNAAAPSGPAAAPIDAAAPRASARAVDRGDAPRAAADRGNAPRASVADPEPRPPARTRDPTFDVTVAGRGPYANRDTPLAAFRPTRTLFEGCVARARTFELPHTLACIEVTVTAEGHVLGLAVTNDPAILIRGDNDREVNRCAMAAAHSAGRQLPPPPSPGEVLVCYSVDRSR